ncbi:MAG: DUF4105 domain-containing protein [Pseudomonadota bacterium]
MKQEQNAFRLFDPAVIKRRPLRSFTAGIAITLLIFVLIIGLRQPSHDRDWRPEISIMPKVEQAGSEYTIDHVRDWTYSDDGPVSTEYLTAAYDTDDLQGAWLMVEPFGGTDAIAHTLVIFEFSDDRLLGLTIEARKEEGEIYSALKGALNTFELVYLWGEPRDLLTRRARYLKHEIFLYPLELSAADRNAFFGALVAKTNALYDRPRFYNTLFSNCTNELAKTAGLPWNSAFILTGYSPQHLWREGVVPGRAEGAAFEDMRARADMAETIKALPDGSVAEFNSVLMEQLRERFGVGRSG